MTKTDVFISYSHEDAKYLKQFARHLSTFKNKIDIWDDTRIKPGDIWRQEIENALINSKVAVLLISADFFHSDFISKVELPTLLQRAEEKGTHILSVIIKPCLFDEYPELNKFQAINRPDKTLLEMTEYEQEQVWIKTVKEIKTKVNLGV